MKFYGTGNSRTSYSARRIYGHMLFVAINSSRYTVLNEVLRDWNGENYGKDCGDMLRQL